MGLGNDLIRKMDGLLRGPYDPQEAAKVGTWIEANFRVKLPRTPRGQKALKQQVNVFLWALRVGGAARESQVRDDWAAIKPQVPDLVRYFSDEGITNVPKEIKSGPVTYLNWVGLDAKKLQAFTKSLDALWGSLKGWRRKALDGGLKVALAGPEHFRGTAAGVYKSDKDTLLVRATPKVLKRTPGQYGSPDYILVHELGHRYERKHPPTVDFERSTWFTTPYSMQTGQDSFAELFALGHFGITKAHRTWDPAIQDRFEAVMSGRSATQRVAARWVGLRRGR